ncbi:hypothetical protein AM501_29010 [Aneurinibacillus migulanus]|uniref:Uncharacterized protein n=1 Tax=Aneurinibacillus migulanus TaxID=47500 RepID=A0A0D1XE14_ANEMI|nr:hypothetical protein [Aneurinibacillus migulanus]KIV50192.1 hypothetical protein TS65_30700 [Aneurinibacillus migulanus]KIV52606.1 hypothetical protein TS64_21495 [Aneurinibacillus migulanus]KON96227.1 hypothetical protein AF333_12790 [Aneurinibacillus migulanus]KPD04935.1 hypothetical protein AM501_29010 [Aneurinibacillus migulanus]MED0895487.1 hypothetical protein [Aneurinibacillus migulanus]
MNTRRYWVSPGNYPGKNNGKSMTVRPGNNTFGLYGSSQHTPAAKKGGCACGGPKIVKGK